MRRALCIVVLTLVAALPARARDRDELQYLGQNTGAPVDPALRRRLAYAQADEPAWVLKALVGQHPKRRPPAQHLLFHQSERPTYVAAVWRGGWPADSKFVLYRVTPGTPPRLKPVGTWEDERLAIVEPSGQDVHRDGTPVLFLEEGSGGSGYEGYRLHIFRLEDAVRDVTPPLRTVWAEDIDDDGVVEVASSDDRWANLFHGCGQCGPLVPVISVWRDGAYRPACRDKAAFLRERMARIRQWLKDDGSLPPEFQMAGWAELTLLHLQLGEADAAQDLYQATLDGLAEARSASPAKAPLADKLERRLRDAVGPALDRGNDFKDDACPLLANGGGGHDGWHDRLRRFGWKQPSK